MSSAYDKETPGYTPATVMEEAARCLLCHDAPCSQDCPAGTDPGKFIRSIRCYISCYDGAHQAIKWDEQKRRPSFDRERCVGCLLCKLVCPVKAIIKGDVTLKPGRQGKAEEKVV